MDETTTGGIKKGPDGRFIKGNKPPGGRPKNSANRLATARVPNTIAGKKAVRQVAETVRLAAQENIGEILANVIAVAKTDARVGLDFAKMSTPPPARLVNLPPEVVHAAPEARIPMLVALASQGQMDLSQCESLVRLAEREYRAGTVLLVKDALIAVSRANRMGDRALADELLVKLADQVFDMASRTIDHDG
jgi:hypothetical protein